MDRLGGLETAMAAVKERAGLRPDEAVETVIYPRRRTFYEALSDQFGGIERRGQPAARARRRARSGARDRVGHRAGRLFRRGEPLALMPFAFVR